MFASKISNINSKYTRLYILRKQVVDFSLDTNVLCNCVLNLSRL